MTTARDLLDALTGNVHTRRQACVDEIELVLAWADLHDYAGNDTRPGGDRSVELGGAGTPEVSELCWAELAVAREAGVIATRNLAADALELRHRLPQLLEQVRELRVEVWVARKVAAMTRPLSHDAVALVDQAVVEAWQQPAGKILALAEAKVIEADPDAHRRRIAENAVRTGVWRPRPRVGDKLGGEAGACEPATGRISAQLPLTAVVDLDATIDEIADKLETDQPDLTRDQLRAQALALLADPAAAAALLGGGEAATKRPRRDATLYIHLAEDPGIARCEQLGPLLLEQVTDLLAHRNVKVQPVIDLNTVQAVNAYEHPTRMKERTILRMAGGTAFPHSTSTSRRVDHDHVEPYDPDGPPGQTSDLNDAPLTRLEHRTKTHYPGWHLEQTGLASYCWTTPHGLVRIVTPQGTRTDARH